MTSFHNGRVEVWEGDCREVLAGFDADSFDSAVTDPPYHFASIVKRFGADNAAEAKSNGATGVYKRASKGFMGRTWDGGQIAHEPATWAAVLRVLKPGAHLVAFHAPKNWHRQAMAIEDAGFEIRDNLLWLFGSGFPKSHDVSKAIDRAAGAEREIVGKRPNSIMSDKWREAEGRSDRPSGIFNITTPRTDLAREWEGWGTALKPAYEPIILARKPLSESTIAANVLRWDTGAINVDGCRVALGEEKPFSYPNGAGGSDPNHMWRGRLKGDGDRAQEGNSLGRWPANIIHDGSDEVVSAFPESDGQQGDLNATGRARPTKTAFGDMAPPLPHQARLDTGSAARFFYTAKADADDRLGSKHPTVKPLDLMQWLCRLITPPRGHILDCFAGTGTTAEAALREGFRCTLVEREAEYLADIDRRMALVYEGETGRSVAMAKLLPVGEPLPLFPEAAE